MKRTQATGIYKRGSVYWLSFQKNGKRQWITLETDEFTVAIERANEIRTAPALSLGGEFESEVDKFIAYKLSRKRFTRASADSRSYVLKKFGQAVLKPVESISEQDVQAYYEKILQEREVSTANTYAMILRSFFKWSIEVANLRRLNPCDNMDLTREASPGRKEFCDFKLRDKLIAECPREDLKFALFCGFHAGLRKNEIIEARPFWFDLGEGLLHLRKTPTIQFKDREERTIPLTAQFLAFLQVYGLRDPFMLAPETKHGRSRYRYDFIQPFRAYMASSAYCCGCFTRFTGPACCAHCKKPLASLKWVTPHIMRHTFASLLASKGVSLYKIAKWLGDSPRVVETRYAKLIPKDADIELAFHSAAGVAVAPAASGNSPSASRSQH